MSCWITPPTVWHQRLRWVIQRKPPENDVKACTPVKAWEKKTLSKYPKNIGVSFSSQHILICCSDDCPHQSSTAEKDHKDDEGFKPVMLYYSEARLTEIPPFLAFAFSDVYSQTWPVLHTFWGKTNSVQLLHHLQLKGINFEIQEITL